MAFDKTCKCFVTVTHQCAIIPRELHGCRDNYDKCLYKDTVHQGFIPVPVFRQKFLNPDYEGYTDDQKGYIELMIECTVKITVNYVSSHRPKTFPREVIDYPLTKSSGKYEVLNGTGYIPYYNIKKREGESCPCHECKDSNNRQKTFWLLPVTTAAHVVFDKYEAKSAVVKLFYDTEDMNGVRYLYGFEVLNERHLRYETDSCVMMCVTHDSELVDRLSQLLDRKRIYLGRNTPTGIIVSHPHGISKMVSLGDVDQKCFIPHSDSLLEALIKPDIDFSIDTKNIDGSEGFLKPERIYNYATKKTIIDLYSEEHHSWFTNHHFFSNVHGEHSWQSMTLEECIFNIVARLMEPLRYGLLIFYDPKDEDNKELNYQFVPYNGGKVESDSNSCYIVPKCKSFEDYLIFLFGKRDDTVLKRVSLDTPADCRAILYTDVELHCAAMHWKKNRKLEEDIKSWAYSEYFIEPIHLFPIMYSLWKTTLVDMARAFEMLQQDLNTILVFKNIIAAIPNKPKLVLRRNSFGDNLFRVEIPYNTIFLCRNGNKVQAKGEKLVLLIPPEYEKNIQFETCCLISYSIPACPGSSGAKVYPQHCPPDCEENLSNHIHHFCRDQKRFYSGMVECGNMNLSELKNLRIDIV